MKQRNQMIFRILNPIKKQNIKEKILKLLKTPDEKEMSYNFGVLFFLYLHTAIQNMTINITKQIIAICRNSGF